jgi:hypothetical protein
MIKAKQALICGEGRRMAGFTPCCASPQKPYEALSLERGREFDMKLTKGTRVMRGRAGGASDEIVSPKM